jgi:POT family proton-dependent oligopeptide transporter
MSHEQSIEIKKEARTFSHSSEEEYHQQQDLLLNDPNIIRQGEAVPGPAWFIIVTELCERFAYYGASLMFNRYLQKHLGQSKPAATAINRGFQFFCYFTAIIGAVIADVKLGRYRTILLFSSLYAVGLILLAISALPVVVDGGFGLAGFIISTYVFIACGTGGIKANVSTFAAEQVKDGIHPTEDSNVYIDSRITVESVFRYFYWAINLGAFLGMLICPMVSQVNSPNAFTYAFLIPVGIFVLGIGAFVVGSGKYLVKAANGSALIKAWNCIMYAARNTGNVEKYSHWLDKSKGATGVNWNDRFVDDLKKTLAASKVFLFYPFYWALYNNMSDIFINQGTGMMRPSWLTAESLNLINSLVLVISIPLFDSFVFPLMRRMGMRLGPISRITIGFWIMIIGFIYATVLQVVLYKTGPFYDFTDEAMLKTVPKGEDPMNDLSIWWQMPPYAIIAISEIFSSATGLEFAYKFATSELKSTVMALFLFTNCGGSIIGILMAPLSKDPYMVTLLGSQTAVMAIIAVIFYYMFRHLDNVDA